MGIVMQEFQLSEIGEMTSLWNSIVEEGRAFPQIEKLSKAEGIEFFSGQSFTGLALDGKEIKGLYILHPNNVGRCGHISNASYCVKAGTRGSGIGEILVRHSMAQAHELGFRILQFNAVVADNRAALKLYRKLGFTQLGTIPGGFLSKSGEYKDIIPHYIEL